MISTPLTRLLGVRCPVVCSPMAGAAGGLLAARVHRGGGFGFIAGGHQPVEDLVKEIAIARRELELKDDDPLPVGIGLIAWRIEAPASTSEATEQFISAIIEARPAALWLSFGMEIHRWINEFRSRRKNDFKICVMVPNVEAALEAASWNVDVVVAQGIEAGGHGYHEALPLLSLLPLVSRGFSKLEAPPVLIGAGGLVNGSQLAAILPFADGAVMGTRFLACPEALYSDEQKQLLVRTTRTKRTTVFDYCRSTEGFPVGVNGRAIENETTAEADISGVTEALRLKYLDAVKVKDVKRIVTWSGTSIGLVDQILPAAEIVEEIEKEALHAIHRLQSMVV